VARGNSWILAGAALVAGGAAIAWYAWNRRGSGKSGLPIRLQVEAELFNSPDGSGSSITRPVGSTVYIDNDDAQQGDWSPVYIPGGGTRVYWTLTANLVQIQ
jgi:hypothetical protein